MADVATVKLRGGARMPAIGLGVWKIARAACADAVYGAIKLGYRCIDSACDYGNERETGAGIKRAIDEGLVKREELWVTSKIWMTYHDPKHVEAALQRSLDDLGLEYLDLWLIHFPISLKFVPFETRYPPEWTHDPSAAKPCMVYDDVPLIETFRAMRALSGPAARVRHCGVCNMTTGLLADLSRACSRAGVEPPEVLQVECHPYLVQGRLLRFCSGLGVAVTAFSPLGAASYVELSMATPDQSALADPVIVAVAARLGCTPAQAVLAWHLRRGVACIPKSSNAARLAENLAAGGVAPRLSDEDVRAISALDRHKRFNDPGQFTQGMNSFAPIFD